MEQQFVCIHVEEEGRPATVELPIRDHRFNQPIAIYQSSNNSTGLFQRLLLTKIGETETAIAAPNEIALALGVSRNAFIRAKNRRDKLVELATKKGTIHGEDVTQFYDFIEDLQICVIFIYKAVESLCNAVIPDDFVHEVEDGKGIIQRYRKEQIERWISTSVKVKEILPGLLGSPKPTEQPFWSDFKVLERLRNDIVHSKSSSSAGTLSELFSGTMGRYLQSAFLLIDFFYQHSSDRRMYPALFGNMRIPVVSVDNLEEHFEQVD